MSVVETERQRNKRIFEELPVPKAVAEMALPMIISQLIILVYNMADTFFIGRTNNPYMVAGASLILPIFNVSIAFAHIAGTGGGTLIARLLGQGRIKDARNVASFSFSFSLAAAVVFALGTALFMHPLLGLLGASDRTFAYAKTYATCVIVCGAIPTVLSMTLGNLLRNSGKAKEAGLGVSMGGIINIILDPLFMFVLLPKGNEILGAGIATALSNFIICTFFLMVIARMKSEILNFSTRNPVPEKEQIRSFFAVGMPAAAGPFLFDLGYIVLDRLMAGHGDTALAAIGIVLKVERFPLNIGIGLCLGMTPLAAYNFSSGNRRRMEDILKFTRKAGVIISLISILLYEVFAPQLVHVFISDTATVEYGVQFLRIRALATVMMFLSFIYVHFFQAVGRGDRSLLLVVLRWLIVNIPMLFLLNALFAEKGLAWAQAAGDSIVAAVSWYIYHRFRKSEEKKILMAEAANEQ